MVKYAVLFKLPMGFKWNFEKPGDIPRIWISV